MCSSREVIARWNWQGWLTIKLQKLMVCSWQYCYLFQRWQCHYLDSTSPQISCESSHLVYLYFEFSRQFLRQEVYIVQLVQRNYMLRSQRLRTMLMWALNFSGKGGEMAESLSSKGSTTSYATAAPTGKWSTATASSNSTGCKHDSMELRQSLCACSYNGCVPSVHTMNFHTGPDKLLCRCWVALVCDMLGCV